MYAYSVVAWYSARKAIQLSCLHTQSYAVSTVDAGVGAVCRHGNAIPTLILQRASVNPKCRVMSQGARTLLAAYGDTLRGIRGRRVVFH